MFSALLSALGPRRLHHDALVSLTNTWSWGT